ncbi:MAG TPA: MlaD family protein [Phycisphaerae bacterium]|nr:MlaD family protein [Phycisphaerae bacterium]
MNAQQYHFRLGLFALGGIALVVGGILLFGQGNWFKPTLEVETYFDQSVSGLTVGAPVRHRGVDVGRVTKIGFVTSKYKVPPGAAGSDEKHKYSLANWILVEMAVSRDAVQPLDSPGADPEAGAAAMVKDGLRLKLVSSLLGGGGYLDADFISDPLRAPIPKIPWTPTGIYIPSQPSSASQLMDTLDHIATDVEDAKPGDLLRHIDGLVIDAKRITAGVNSSDLQNQISSLISDLRATTHSLQKILDDPHIPTLLADATGTATNARILTDPEKSNLVHFIADLRTTAGRLNSLLEDPALKQAIANTGPLTTDARRTVARLAELISSEQIDLTEMIQSLKASAQNVEAITSDAKDNPSRILFGEPPPRGKLLIVPASK